MFMCLIAQAQNTGFESGNLTGWTSSGSDVGISTGLINENFGGSTWTIRPYGTHMGQLYPSGSVTFDSATASLGLSSTDNTSVKNYLIQQAQNGGGDPTPTNAAWIKRTVTLEAGTTYRYAWNYLSTDYTPFNDGSMITLIHSTNGSITPTINNLQKKYGLLGFTNPGTGEYATGSYGSTGWQQVVFTVPVTGDYVLGFATFNLGDTALSPMLFIDELQGITEKDGQSFGPIDPNPGSSAPSSGGGSPTVTGTSTTNNVSSSSSTGSTTTTTNSYNWNNNYTVIGTSTPTNTTTTTTPVTTTTWSDGTTTTSNGTSTTTTSITYTYTVTGPNTPPISPNAGTNTNSVYVTQINAGAANNITANQSGHGNYQAITLGGSNNTVRLGQGYTFGAFGAATEGAISNYNLIVLSVSGDANTASGTQVGTSNSAILSNTGNSNSLALAQTGNNNQVYSIVSGIGNSLTIGQNGNSNIASVNLYGNSNSATVTQTGNNHGTLLNLVNAGGANTVSVVQTGAGDAYSLQQTCTNPSGCSVSVIRNK